MGAPGQLSDAQVESYLQELRDMCVQARYAFQALLDRLDSNARGREWYMDQVRRETGNPAAQWGPYSSSGDYIAAFYADAVVNLAARITRLLWPTGVRGGQEVKEWAESRGASLRAAVGIDSDPVMESGMRSSIEHVDERLDELTRRQPDANYRSPRPHRPRVGRRSSAVPSTRNERRDT